ncbi:MAG: GDP-L-fucose synthase [Syntrophales bacterium]|nr:GDP-L-fucose synthase [Syntrophales bacterium]
MNKESRVFVSGGTGMVGSAIVRKLLERGYTNIISNYHRKIPSHSYPSTVNFHQLDLTNQALTEQFFESQRPEYVFLSAARVGGILANNTYKAEFIYENIAIASNIIHLSYKYGVKKLLNLGSSCIYPKFSPQPMKEEYLLTGLLEPTNEPYAVAKIAAIKLCRYYNEQYGTNFISCMPTNLYGPNDNFDLFTSHVLPALLRKMYLAKCIEDENWVLVRKDFQERPVDGVDGSASEGEILQTLERYGIKRERDGLTMTMWGTGNVYREFLYVDDCADACIFLMESVDAKDIKKLSEDYFVNVGTGEDLKVKELALLIKDIVGFKGNVDHDLSKPDGTPRKLLDISKLRQLGWAPKTPLEEGIRKTFEWYLKSGV